MAVQRVGAVVVASGRVDVGRLHFDPGAIERETILGEFPVSSDDVERVSWVRMHGGPPLLILQRCHRGPDGSLYPIRGRSHRVGVRQVRQLIDAIVAAAPYEAEWRAGQTPEAREARRQWRAARARTDSDGGSQTPAVE